MAGVVHLPTPPISNTPTGTHTPNAGSGPKPRILVPEKVSPDGLALLSKTLEIDEKKGLSPEELKGIIGEYEALIVRSETKVTKELLEAGKKLKVVARAGVGVDNVDVPTATNLGIIVVNSPSGNINAAAEHTIALMMATARNIGSAHASLSSGKWERSKLVGVEVKGKILGIIGLGKVGVTVARMAIGLGMRVEALDPYASPQIAQAAHVTMVQNLNELLENADFLTIHTPLIASTKGMIGKSELRTMKKGSRVLNVARGGMIDEAALVEALDEGHIAAAGIDVFTSEPPTADSTASKLTQHPRAVVTPHLGASTVEAQENVSIDVCEQVLNILSGELPRSAVNAPLILPDEYKTLQPFVKLVEKIGSLYTQQYSIRNSSDGLTFELIYEGELAKLGNTKPLYAALVKGLIAPISDSNVNIVNAELIAKARGIVINEQKSRDVPDHAYSSFVTLRAKPSASSRATSPFSPRGGNAPLARATSAFNASNTLADRQISGYVSGTQVYISRLDKFATAFAPDGNLLLVGNYDSPGMIGTVGGFLGKENVNINFMTVAPLQRDLEANGDNIHVGGGVSASTDGNAKEALMILGVDREVDASVIQKLKTEKGILDVSAVVL